MSQAHSAQTDFVRLLPTMPPTQRARGECSRLPVQASRLLHAHEREVTNRAEGIVFVKGSCRCFIH